MKSLEQWLSYIESLHPENIEMGLERLNAVAQKLQVTQFEHPVITVAGTNGKGSTVAMIAALATASRISVAAYTSPHIFQFKERLLIDGEMLDDAAWCDAFAMVESSRNTTELTYFEFTTLAALVLIKQRNVALAVLEIGLGGRLDAVNIVDNQVSVITSIDYDHQDWLGDSLSSIAYEKSGVARRDTPVILGSDRVAELVGLHLDKSCHPLVATQDLPLIAPSSKLQPLSNTPDVQTREELVCYISAKLSSVIHPVSFRCALLAFEQLFGRCANHSIKKAYERVELKGRWQTLPNVPNIWFDVAHNPEAVANLVNKMTSETQIDKWVALCGMLSDKDAEDAIRPLKDNIDEWHFISTDGPRGQSSVELMDQVAPLRLKPCYHYSSNATAINTVLSCRDDNQGILVFGSFLVVANVFECLKNKSEQTL